MTEIFIPTIKQSVMIKVFVLLMMVVIDYINVQSKNNKYAGWLIGGVCVTAIWFIGQKY